MSLAEPLERLASWLSQVAQKNVTNLALAPSLWGWRAPGVVHFSPEGNSILSPRALGIALWSSEPHLVRIAVSVLHYTGQMDCLDSVSPCVK